MKKENFVKAINAILEQEKRDRAFEVALEPFFDSYLIFQISQDFQNTVTSILEDEMDDPDRGSEYGSLISWWLWDAPGAGKNDGSAYLKLPDGKKYTLQTPEQLYDYLAMQKEIK